MGLTMRCWHDWLYQEMVGCTWQTIQNFYRQNKKHYFLRQFPLSNAHWQCSVVCLEFPSPIFLMFIILISILCIFPLLNDLYPNSFGSSSHFWWLMPPIDCPKISPRHGRIRRVPASWNSSLKGWKGARRFQLQLLEVVTHGCWTAEAFERKVI